MRPLDLSRLFMSVGLPMVIFPITFWLQIKLGYEVSLFPLFMLPIAALSWSFGLPGAFFSVLLATGLWYWGNILSGYDYTYEWTRYYNTGARAVVFAMVAVFIILFKRVVEQHRRRMEAMRALLNVCHGCGSVQGSDGRWIPFDQLTVSSSRPLLCECPECKRMAQVVAGRRTGDGARGTESGGRKAETGGQGAEGGSEQPWPEGGAEAGGRKAEDGGRVTEDGSQKPEGENLTPEVRSWKPGDEDRRKYIRREEDR